MKQLGACHKASGLEVCLLAPSALAMDICLLDPRKASVQKREPMQPDGGYWFIDGLDWEPGSYYAFCCKPSWQQANSMGLLALDPMARWVIQAGPGQYLAQTVTDLEPASRLKRPLDAARLLYELHPKGFSQLQSAIPAELRGSIEALAHPVITAYLQRLGVTTLCLMPICFHDDEPRLRRLGLSNYWGYNVLAWNAPYSPYLATVRSLPASTAWKAGRRALRDTVERLHQEGFEVILDVVYNHSAELDEQGPAYHLRVLDSAFYYHHDTSGRLENWSGCGNSLNFSDLRAVDWVIQSLRQWVTEFGVDGFRFDLATSLMRLDDGLIDRRSSASLWARLRSDPLVGQCLLIAEPWDLGPCGYQLGGFGNDVLEWNDQYRDTLRMFWNTESSSRARLADCLAGSSGMFEHQKTFAFLSVNYLASHDGFSLADLVSYSERHNHSNGEDNRDGHAFEHAFNHGHEGQTEDQELIELRKARQAAMLCCLYASLGTVMLHAGDEWGRSQYGNNNAYCQDNALSWLRWDEADQDQLALCQKLMRLRNRFHVLLAGTGWWTSQRVEGSPQTRWLSPSGLDLEVKDWQQAELRSLALWLCGGPELLLLINGHAHALSFRLPSHGLGWECLIDSSNRQTWYTGAGDQPRWVDESISVNAWSVLWLSPFEALPDLGA